MNEKITDVKYFEKWDDLFFKIDNNEYHINKKGNLEIEINSDFGSYRQHFPIDILKQIIELYENRKNP
jgi:hypothetical protein